MSKDSPPIATPSGVYDFSDIVESPAYLRSGSVEWDLATALNFLKAIASEWSGEGPAVLNPEDPMADIRVMAAYVAVLFDSLQRLGFACPDVDYWVDPIHFVRTTLSFLTWLQPYVADAEPVTVH